MMMFESVAYPFSPHGANPAISNYSPQTILWSAFVSQNRLHGMNLNWRHEEKINAFEFSS